MRNLRIAATLLGLALGFGRAWAWEPSLLNLTVPSALQPGQFDLLFEHRFYGSVLDNPLQNLFGLTTGANVGLGVRSMILPGLQARAVYTTGGQELDLGVGYGYHFASVPLALQADASFITPEGLAGRGYGVFASVAAEAGPLVNLFYLAVEAGYDSYLNHLGTGIGARIELTPEIALLGEVYPFFLLGKEQHPEELGSTSAWSAGAMLSIAGHQFSLLVGNSPALGERRLMAGAPPFGGIYLGFNIQRLLPL